MKILAFFLVFLTFPSCQEVGKNPSSSQENKIETKDISYENIAAVTDQNSDVVSFLEDNGIESFLQGSVVHGLFVRSDQVEEALLLLKDRDDWGRSLISNEMFEDSFKD